MSVSVQVLFHSSIRIAGSRVIYFDPFRIEGYPHDADVVFITHEHYDHLSDDDIDRVCKKDTMVVAPASCLPKIRSSVPSFERTLTVDPGQEFEVKGLKVTAVPAYNVGKQFHVKEKKWLGYVVSMDGERFYVAGDTDRNPDNEQVKCDVALVPVGGHFTMDPAEAAELVNIIRPRLAIPTHYGEVAGDPDYGRKFAALVDKDIAVEIQLPE